VAIGACQLGHLPPFSLRHRAAGPAWSRAL